MSIGHVVFRWSWLVSLLVFTLSCTNQLNFQEGIASFHTEDYRQAFIRLKSEAMKGQPDAEYAVGYMYFYGKGVIEDKKQAWLWINRAAKAGQHDASIAITILKKT